jgi:hypothetical protein
MEHGIQELRTAERSLQPSFIAKAIKRGEKCSDPDERLVGVIRTN